MPEKDNIAPAEGSGENKQPVNPTAPADGAKPEAKKEETVGEALDVTPKSEGTPPKKEEPETVPLATFLEIKGDNKKLTKQIEDLQKTIESGASRGEVSADLQAIADEHNVDPKFLKDLEKAIRAKAKQEATEEVETKLKPLQEKERAEKINTAFNAGFSKAMESMPEYDGIVKKDVIKALSLLPENANKTFAQLIEESFGHLITGKRTIDAGSSRAGKNDTGEVDIKRAQTDPDYFKEVMANPITKKKYNDSMTDRIASQL